MHASEHEQEIVQYYVVNEDLMMSTGKIAVQVAHAATTLTLHHLFNHQENSRQHELFQAWLKTSQRKVILCGSDDQVRLLAQNGFLAIQDAGHSEVPAGSLTVVVMPPMLKSESGKFTDGFKAL